LESKSGTKEKATIEIKMMFMTSVILNQFLVVRQGKNVMSSCKMGRSKQRM